jgi:hypothetical protein
MSGRARRSAGHELAHECTRLTRHGIRKPHQKRAVDRLLAQVNYELLKGHGLVVDADEEVT